MANYKVREGQITTVDTKTELITLGGKSPGSIKVPMGMKKIVEVHSSFVSTMADGAATYLIHLSGDGIKGGTQVIVHGGENYLMTTSGVGGRPVDAKITPTDIEVISGNGITIEGEMSGSDLGTVEAAVGLVFA